MKPLLITAMFLIQSWSFPFDEEFLIEEDYDEDTHCEDIEDNDDIDWGELRLEAMKKLDEIKNIVDKSKSKNLVERVHSVVKRDHYDHDHHDHYHDDNIVVRCKHGYTVSCVHQSPPLTLLSSRVLRTPHCCSSPPCSSSPQHNDLTRMSD